MSKNGILPYTKWSKVCLKWLSNENILNGNTSVCSQNIDFNSEIDYKSIANTNVLPLNYLSTRQKRNRTSDPWCEKRCYYDVQNMIHESQSYYGAIQKHATRHAHNNKVRVCAIEHIFWLVFAFKYKVVIIYSVPNCLSVEKIPMTVKKYWRVF